MVSNTKAIVRNIKDISCTFLKGTFQTMAICVAIFVPQKPTIFHRRKKAEGYLKAIQSKLYGWVDSRCEPYDIQPYEPNIT